MTTSNGRGFGPVIRAGIGALTLVAVAVVISWVLASPSPSASDEAPAASDPALRAAALPSPIEPAFVPGSAQPLGAQRGVTWHAPVRKVTVARGAPDPAAAPVAWISTLTPEGTRNIVLVLGRAQADNGRLWVRARLAGLRNGATGWVPRSALGGYAGVRTHLVVDLDELTATLYHGERPVFRGPVGVGKPESPTPRGEFYIRNKLTRYANRFYGPIAFGTSGRSSALSDWPAGGFIGIHGTDRPDLVPGRVSHGCIRLRNEDILELARLMPVGTPLTIR
jgi:hypothetical protein